MYNPFLRFDPRFVGLFKAKGFRYFVSQSYPRGAHLFQDDSKNCVLLSHYNDKGLAELHYNAVGQKDDNGVKKDKYAALIDLENPEHYKTVVGMCEPDSKYRVFSALTNDAPSIKKATDKIFKDNIENYLRKRNWRIARNETFSPDMEITFGELYIRMKYGKESVRIKLEELENSK